MEKKQLNAKRSLSSNNISEYFTIIDPKFIVMPFPSTELIETLAYYLNTTYNRSYLVFNLSEYSYTADMFYNQVVDYSFPGYPFLPLESTFTLCKEIESWLNSAKSNVAVIHCQQSWVELKIKT